MRRDATKCLILTMVCAFFSASASAQAASCQGGASFEAWLASFKKEAVAQGISPGTVNSALANVSFSQDVVNRDRRQSVFAQDFLTFANRMVAKYRLQKGAQLMQKYASTFSRVEKQYGVPAPVIVAFWGLETDFGANIGDMPTLTSLATLAYDCRRPDLFRHQLLSALRIIDRGDLRADEMRGPWAGELGQTQFLPAHYVDYAVDFDGDGRRDLLRSVPDVLASSANYLKHLGWRGGEPWLEEVRVSSSIPWGQADIATQHSRAQWAAWGVTRANGKALPKDKLPASLLLPMGRDGPAFLAYPNFQVYLTWNQSLVYSTTAAYFATRLAGAGPVSGGKGVASLNLQQTKELQKLLVRQGFDVGKIDGILGAQTRAAVKAMQIKFGMPADSYPTEEFLARLRGG